MEKFGIFNSSGIKLAVEVETPSNPKGLAFIMHGLGGHKEQPHIKKFAAIFLKNGYVTVRFDVANTFGESAGLYENASISSYLNDLNDVINWAKTKQWYQEPYVLVGHSLGGICSLLHAQKNSDRVKAIAPISTVVSGASYSESYSDEQLKDWEKTGWFSKPSKSRPGLQKRLKWDFMVDALNYDIIPEIDKINKPVLLIVGEKDLTTFPRQQKLLYDSIHSDKKELHIISGAPHSFSEESHLNQIESIFDRWIKSI